jgi:hypothetical protein
MNNLTLYTGGGDGDGKGLKALSVKHRQIISLHLQGVAGTRIGKALNCSVGMVYHTINDPLAKKVIDHFISGVENDLEALLPLAVGAVRDGLNSGSTDTKLRAVDKFAKLSGRDEKEEKSGMNITIMGDARVRFVAELKELTEKSVPTSPPAPKVIEGEIVAG